MRILLYLLCWHHMNNLPGQYQLIAPYTWSCPDS